MTTTHLLYLHGFRSSPQSFKARMLQTWLQQHAPAVVWCCPQLPPSPRAAWQAMRDAVRGWPVTSMAVLGSSLGGFYATALAEHLGCRAVVLNPAVDPARDLARHVGEQTAYHDPTQHFEFAAAHLDELRALAPASITRPERYAAVIAQGDELLDWREMSARYRGAHILLLEGSDHALSDFEQQLPFVLDFLALPRARCSGRSATAMGQSPS
ncbi:MAG: hypothetical protein IT390_06315 [Nitrospira sp.]|nr:hypothetical protein [Nitrospira sp.]